MNLYGMHTSLHQRMSFAQLKNGPMHLESRPHVHEIVVCLIFAVVPLDRRSLRDTSATMDAPPDVISASLDVLDKKVVTG